MSGVSYFVSDNSTNMLPGSYGMMQCNNLPSLHYGGFFSNMPNAQLLPPLQDLAIQPQYSLSNNSTSDEADDQQHHDVIDDRRQRRMISNRESARRSRVRKQRYLDELWSQVMRLRSENHNLIERLNQMCESHEKLVQENAKLKKETSDLHQMLGSLQITSPCDDLHELDDITCKTAHVTAASSSQSITSSAGFLQEIENVLSDS